jgi:hypothetical protein
VYSGQVPAELLVRPRIDLPSLTIKRSGPTIQVQWPASADAFQLESSHFLLSTWTAVEIDPVESDGLKTVTLPISPSGQFFRLRRKEPDESGR